MSNAEIRRHARYIAQTEGVTLIQATHRILTNLNAEANAYYRATTGH